jgi:peptide/nickel transport system substrate-binding protein
MSDLHRALILAGVCAAALAVSPAARAQKDSLTIAYPVDVPNWDPTTNTVTGAQSIYKSVFDQPLQYSPDLTLSPDLIAEWHFEGSDGTRLALTLRDGVLFQDGSPLTTEDLKFSFLDRPLKDPTLLIRRMLPPIKAIEIQSPTKAVIVFSAPTPAAPIYLGFLAAYILPKAYIAKVGDEGFRQHPIGAGPYRLTSYERGGRIVLEAFDKYWGGPARIRHETFQIVTDPSARVAAVEAGRADLTSQIPLREVTRLAALPNVTAKAYPYSEIYMIQMPSYVAALTDERVRLAMALSIDKAAISRAFYGGIAVPMSVLATPGSVGDPAGFAMHYDRAKALDLMKQAGYGPDHPLSLPMIATNGAFPNDFEVARAIAAMWKQVGIQAEIQEVPLTKYVDMNHSGTLPGPAVYSWSNPTGDPEMTTGHVLDGALPFSAWKGKEATDRVHALLAETDEAKRMAGYRDLNRDTAEHAWSIALVQSVFSLAYSKSLDVVAYQGGYILPYADSWKP